MKTKNGLKKHDAVNSPYYYSMNGHEVIDVIMAFELNFLEGNVIKYLLRWRRKNGVEDLKKAQFYLNTLIKKEEAKSVLSKESA